MDGIETYLAGAPLVALGAAFFGGILVSLSPCVYPLMPVVSAYVGSKSAGKKTRITSFVLSLGYVAGMSTVYAMLGMFAALTGGFFGRISSNPWSLLVVGGIFLLLALNILEILQLPLWFSGRPADSGLDGVRGAFLVGAASGLVASPCTSPVLFGLLTFVATTRSLFYGVALLFAFSAGMGILLIFIGTFSGLATALPRPGIWMLGIKKGLGFLMLGVAGYYFIRAGFGWFL